MYCDLNDAVVILPPLDTGDYHPVYDLNCDGVADSTGDEVEFLAHYNPHHTCVPMVDIAPTQSPGQLALRPPIPNPSRSGISIQFDLPRAMSVHLKIYDLRGRLVRTGFSGHTMPAGRHSWDWDGLDGAGNRVRSGVYFYVLVTPESRIHRKAVILD
jgi:hypothetical protein